MPAEPSIIGRCPECCECPEPVITWRSRSASKTKCGFVEFGTPSSPPKIYLKKTYDITATDTTCYTCIGPVISSGGSSNFLNASLSISGDCTWDSASCDSVETVVVTLGSSSFTGGSSPCDGGSYNFTTRTDIEPSEGVICDYNPYTDTLQIVGDDDLLDTPVTRFEDITPTVTSTTRTGYQFQGGCPDFGAAVERNLSETLSEEYDNDLLRTNTIAALPAGWPNTTAGSYRNLTTDERTLSIREGGYQWAFKVPKVGSGQCYGLDWIERFTPAGGGDPVDVERNWEWDRTIPEGYDPEDAETWPVTPWFDVEIPAANGTTLVVDVVAYCRDCAA